MEKQKFLEEVFEKTKRYLSQVEKPLNYNSAKKLEQLVNTNFNPHSYEEVLDEIDFYLQHAINTSSPLYNNQLNAGFTLPALAGELISFITNTTMATYEVAPIGTLMEMKLVEKLNQLLGFKDGDGIMTTGGSNANMLAIHCARMRFDPSVKIRGNQNYQFKVFVSDQAHYSFSKAVNLMGLGEGSLIKIASKDGVMDPLILEERIKESIEREEHPLMIASTSGTTVLGTFDDITANQKIADKYKLWHHVDAAWGGAVLFSEKHEKLMKGVEQVDSVTWDAHKFMATGLITSFILLREKGQLQAANQGGGSKYIFHDYENSKYDSGARSLQCGRKVDALKLWLSWKYFGDDGYKQQLHEQLEKVNHLAKLIEDHPRLKLIREPSFLNVCFQVLPTDSNTDINKYNLELRYELVRSGEAMINFSRFEDGTIFFRFVVTNFATTNRDIEKTIELIFSLCK